MVIKKMTSLSEYAKSVEKPKNQKIMKNMAWILHCLAAGKNAGVPKPAAEEKIKTNFIRS